MKPTVRPTLFVLLAFFLSCVPIFWPHLFHHLIDHHIPMFLQPLPWLLVAVALYVCWQFLDNLAALQKVNILLVVTILALVTCYLHGEFVDSKSHFANITNYQWQVNLHQAIMSLDPHSIPHCYRFLPDSMTDFFSSWMGSFKEGKSLYRVIFQIFLIFSIYKWASYYVSSTMALIPCLMYTIIYPITNLGYAGQLTDPMSHLSFVLAFIFIQQRKYWYLILTLIIGGLAKESVAAMAIFYVLFTRDKDQPLLKSIGVLAAALIPLFLVRHWVLGATPGYQQISGVNVAHIWENLKETGQWMQRFVYTIVVWVPLVWMGWKKSTRYLQQLTLYLFLVLFSSSAIFSWLKELRNFVPLFIVMAVIATIGFVEAERSQASPYHLKH